MIPVAVLHHIPPSIHDRLPDWLAPPRPAWEKTLESVFDFIEKNWDILLYTVVGFAAGFNTGACYFIALVIGMGAHLCSDINATDKTKAAIQLQAPGVLLVTTIPLASIVAQYLLPSASLVRSGLEVAAGVLAGMGGVFMQWR